MQNVLKDEEEWEIVLKVGDLEGCPPDFVAASRQAAIDRKKGEEDHVITLSRSMVEPCESGSLFVVCIFILMYQNLTVISSLI